MKGKIASLILLCTGAAMCFFWAGWKGTVIYGLTPVVYEFWAWLGDQ